MNNLAILPGHAGHSCRGLSFGSGDSRFVSAGDDGYIRIWGFEEKREERGWRGVFSCCRSVFLPCCLVDGVRFFHSDPTLSVASGHGQDVRCVDWHPTKGLIVSGSTDDKVSFWDPRSGQALASYVLTMVWS